MIADARIGFEELIEPIRAAFRGSAAV